MMVYQEKPGDDTQRGALHAATPTTIPKKAMNQKQICVSVSDGQLRIRGGRHPKGGTLEGLGQNKRAAGFEGKKSSPHSQKPNRSFTHSHSFDAGMHAACFCWRVP